MDPKMLMFWVIQWMQIWHIYLTAPVFLNWNFSLPFTSIKIFNFFPSNTCRNNRFLIPVAGVDKRSSYWGTPQQRLHSKILRPTAFHGAGTCFLTVACFLRISFVQEWPWTNYISSIVSPKTDLYVLPSRSLANNIVLLVSLHEPFAQLQPCF